MGKTVYARALQRAVEVLGSKEHLRALLRVPMRDLDDWIAGTRQPPMDVFLKAVDVMSAPVPPVAMRASLVAGKPGAPIRIEQDFLHAEFASDEGRSMVESAIDAALVAGRARKGNLQLRFAEGLRIVAHRGFQQPFLDFFACVHDAGAVCGRAMAGARRVVVPDIGADPIGGTPAGAVLREADVRAVQSTPILADTGELLGMISTHYEEPLHAGAMEFDILDRIADRAARWLQGNAAAR